LTTETQNWEMVASDAAHQDVSQAVLDFIAHNSDGKSVRLRKLGLSLTQADVRGCELALSLLPHLTLSQAAEALERGAWWVRLLHSAATARLLDAMEDQNHGQNTET